LGRTESRRSGSFSFETVVSELILSKHKKSDPRKKTSPVKGLVNVGPTETFHQLSLVLTAARVLPSDLVQSHFKHAEEELGSKLTELLDRFATLTENGRDPVQVIREEILTDANLGPTAKTVLLLWYIGGVRNAAGDWEVQSADHYYRALVWDAIGAHPPTLSNGYYGHWKYPAER
jgi:hypothetical protein